MTTGSVLNDPRAHAGVTALRSLRTAATTGDAYSDTTSTASGDHATTWVASAVGQGSRNQLMTRPLHRTQPVNQNTDTHHTTKKAVPLAM